MRLRTKARIAAVAVAALVLAMGAVLTRIAVSRSHVQAEKNAAEGFQKIAYRLAEAVEMRITVPRYGLGGFRSSISALGHVPSVNEFRLAVAARDLPKEFPGVVGFGFIQPVSDRDMAAFTVQAAAEFGGDFHTDAKAGTGIHYIIRSVEPLERNRAALGYDLGADAARRSAVKAAISPGSIVLTIPIHLKQIGPQAWGALYLMPVYRYTIEATGSAAALARPTQLIGWVEAAVNYSAVLTDLEQGSSLASYALSDTTDGKAIPLFVSQPDANGRKALFNFDIAFELGGRRFTLHAASLPAFERATLATQLSLKIALGGGLITLLAALLAFELVLRQMRAIDLARKMISDIDRLAAVGRLTNDAIAITDNAGRITWVNPAFTRLSGQSEESLLKDHIAGLVTVAGSDEPSAAFIGRLLSSRAQHRGEAQMRTADGRMILTEIEIQPYTGRLATTTGLVVIQSDITQRKRDEEALRESLAFLDHTGQAAGIGGWQYDLLTGKIAWSAHTRRIHEVPEDFVPNLENATGFYAPEARAILEKAMHMAIDTGKGWDLEMPFVTYRDRHIWVRAMGLVELENDKPVRLTGAFQDITRRKHDELELAKNRELLKVTLSSIGDAVITTDDQGRVTWINPVAETMMGMPLEEAKGRPITDVLPLVNQDTRNVVVNPILMALHENRTVGLATNTILVSPNGEWGIEDSASPIQDAQGNVIGGVMVFHDVTEARAIQREVSDRARHDTLTGLFNRHEFEERLRRYMSTVNASWKYGAVFFIDLDHFKLVNDTGGHAAGDQLLCQIAQLIQSRVRVQDSVARLGGDEFAILLENCSMKNAELMAQGICDTIDQYRFVANAGQVFRVGASVGIVFTEEAWSNCDELMRAADEACRTAKESGRNRYHVWNSTDESIQLRAGDTAWSVRLEDALDHDGFELFAQRIEVLKPEHRLGFHAEVLLRMKDGDNPVIGPALFMPAAERFQLANRIDRWVVQRVFEELSAPQLSLPPGSMISVNLSGQSVGDRAFHHFVLGLIDRAAFDPRMLCFEITETAAITNLGSASTFLEAVRKRGIRVALDDFGAGVASFGYLRSLLVDLLKIDGQYVQGMGCNPLDLVSIRSFCEVAKVLGVRTIAEFVETQEQFDAVRSLGIDCAQGYFIHKPEPFSALLASKATHPINESLFTISS